MGGGVYAKRTARLLEEGVMRLVDLSAGTRSIWFNKNHPDAVYIDIRPEVNPTLIVDSRKTGLPSANFGLVVFDPPHANFSKNGNMSKNYGHHTAAQIKEIIKGTAREAHRITYSNALMAFKWNDHDLKLESALKLLEPYWEPLFGQKTSIRTLRASTTYWVMLKRKARKES
jgi:hypothetical protein